MALSENARVPGALTTGGVLHAIFRIGLEVPLHSYCAVIQALICDQVTSVPGSLTHGISTALQDGIQNRDRAEAVPQIELH